MCDLVRFFLMQRILITIFIIFYYAYLWDIEAQNLRWNMWKSKVDKQKETERVLSVCCLLYKFCSINKKKKKCMCIVIFRWYSE